MTEAEDQQRGEAAWENLGTDQINTAAASDGEYSAFLVGFEAGQESQSERIAKLEAVGRAARKLAEDAFLTGPHIARIPRDDHTLLVLALDDLVALGD